jgi:hypothetical protein
MKFKLIRKNFIEKFLSFLSSLANKQDRAEALDKNAILEDLRIERLVNDNQTLCRVVRIKTKAQINN